MEPTQAAETAQQAAQAGVTWAQVAYMVIPLALTTIGGIFTAWLKMKQAENEAKRAEKSQQQLHGFVRTVEAAGPAAKRAIEAADSELIRKGETKPLELDRVIFEATGRPTGKLKRAGLGMAWLLAAGLLLPGCALFQPDLKPTVTILTDTIEATRRRAAAVEADEHGIRMMPVTPEFLRRLEENVRTGRKATAEEAK